MNWTLEKATGIVSKLLLAQTYRELTAYEEEFKEQGLSIGDDFVKTENRRIVLEKIRRQLQNTESPSVLLTGWFGSGKTTVMRRVMDELASGKLAYGSLQASPIEVRLNEHNTLSLFLETVFESLCSINGEQRLVEVYKKA